MASIIFQSIHGGQLLYCTVPSQAALKLFNSTCLLSDICKVSKGAKIRNRYNQVPHLTQATNGRVTNSQLDTT